MMALQKISIDPTIPKHKVIFLTCQRILMDSQLETVLYPSFPDLGDMPSKTWVFYSVVRLTTLFPLLHLGNHLLGFACCGMHSFNPSLHLVVSLRVIDTQRPVLRSHLCYRIFLLPRPLSPSHYAPGIICQCERPSGAAGGSMWGGPP